MSRDGNHWTGDELLSALSALASHPRLRIVAELASGPVHVSELARRIRLSRPLTHMHLQRLERAGLVRGHLELSDDGKALKFFEVAGFSAHLTPAMVAAAVETLSDDAKSDDVKGD